VRGFSPANAHLKVSTTFAVVLSGSQTAAWEPEGNNVLVIVFLSQFFGLEVPLVAAMYMIPFFVLVIPLRYYRHRKTRLATYAL
jgi:hypothetical protein